MHLAEDDEVRARARVRARVTVRVRVRGDNPHPIPKPNQVRQASHELALQCLLPLEYMRVLVKYLYYDTVLSYDSWLKQSDSRTEAVTLTLTLTLTLLPSPYPHPTLTL